jgi:hypothetical protein
VNVLIQLASLFGAAIVLFAYLMLQRRKWSDRDGVYLWFNLVGAILLIIVALWDRRAGFVILESVWAGISLWSLVSNRLNPRTASST